MTDVLDLRADEVLETPAPALPAYPVYKDSDVEWLGEIPAHWEVKRLRFVLTVRPSPTEVARFDPEMLVSFLPMELITDDGDFDRENSKPLNEIGSGYTYFAEGDVTIAKITPCFENGKGALMNGLINGIGFGTTELHVLRPACHLNQEFLYYLTMSDPFRKLGTAQMYGAGGQKRVPEDFIRDFRCGIPPLSEQLLIVAFLDRETTKLDTIAAQKERLIRLLEEKRTALISQVVTKGLDSNVPMKDSDVEWLGEIPNHWKIKRLKHISPQQAVGVVVNPSSYVTVDGVIPFLLGSDISAYSISIENVRKISRESNGLLAKSILRMGDLVMVRVGAPGVTAVVPPELDGCNCASVMLIRRSKKFISQWLCYAMNSPVGKAQVEMVEYGAAQKQFNISHAIEFVYPTPPLPEQLAIVAYLDRETAKLDGLIAKIRQQIEKLREYRTALTSASVTGKIDVRAAMSE